MKRFLPAFCTVRFTAGLFVLVSVGSSVSISSAQQNGRQSPPPAQHGNDPAARAAEEAEQQQALTEAVALYNSRNPAAEERLLRGNRHEPTTLGWQIESANKLTHLALILRQEYDYSGALAVATRALAVLDDAEKLARRADAHQRALVQEMTAFLLEEIVRDPESARAAFEKARQANPSSKRAEQGLARLQEEKAKQQRLAGNR